jgi:hypothetical protein
MLYIKRLGVPIPNSVLVPPTVHDGATRHPISNVIYNEMMLLMELSFKLDDADDDVSGLDPKEYVPDISMSKYLGTRSTLRQGLTSSLMLDALKTYTGLSK